MSVYVFNNIDTGEVWTARADSLVVAASLIPKDAEWDDYFEVEDEKA